MSKVTLLLIACGVLFLGFVLFAIQGFRNGNKPKIVIAFTFLLFCIIAGLWSTAIVFKRVVHKAKEIAEEAAAARTGPDIYKALFNPPSENCSEVTRQMDQFFPRIDCCIWLEFKTCPKELKRIIENGSYKSEMVPVADSSIDIPRYRPAPSWWKPSVLGDSLLHLIDYTETHPNRAKILLFDKDSTRAFYCDMAE